MTDRPIRNRGWRKVVISRLISENASDLRFGFTFTGIGSAWIDDVKLETAQP